MRTVKAPFAPCCRAELLATWACEWQDVASQGTTRWKSSSEATTKVAVVGVCEVTNNMKAAV